MNSYKSCEESIKEVEKIAQILFERSRKECPSENDVQTMCKMLGGYIGEVYLKNQSGSWAVNEKFNKVYQRLTNGSEDNLWHYFYEFLLDEEDKMREEEKAIDRKSSNIFSFLKRLSATFLSNKE